jgi:hypothetical protein
MSSEDEGSRRHLTWWSTWGKPAAYLLLGIVGVVAAMAIALLLVGVLF